MQTNVNTKSGPNKQQNTHSKEPVLTRQTEPGLVTFYDIQPVNRAGLFFQPCSPHGAIPCTSVDDTHHFSLIINTIH